jgi:hypothetical protein
MHLCRVFTIAAVGLSLGGAALAQSVGPGRAPDSGVPQGTAPRLERGVDSQGMERGSTTNPLDRNTLNGRDAPQDMTNPQQAPATEPVASESRIRSMLEKQGYSNVQNIQREGDAYTATAMKGSETVNLRIDPQLGQIQEHGG